MKTINKFENDRHWLITLIRVSSSEQETARNYGLSLRTFDNYSEDHQVNWKKELHKDLFLIETNFFKWIKLHLLNLRKTCQEKRYFFFGFCLIITIPFPLINKNNKINSYSTIFPYSIERHNPRLFYDLKHKNEVSQKKNLFNSKNKMLQPVHEN